MQVANFRNTRRLKVRQFMATRSICPTRHLRLSRGSIFLGIIPPISNLIVTLRNTWFDAAALAFIKPVAHRGALPNCDGCQVSGRDVVDLSLIPPVRAAIHNRRVSGLDIGDPPIADVVAGGCDWESGHNRCRNNGDEDGVGQHRIDRCTVGG